MRHVYTFIYLYLKRLSLWQALCLCCLACSSLLPARAQDTIKVRNDERETLIGANVWLLSQENDTIEDVSQLLNNPGFKPSNKSIINFAPGPAAQWLRFSLTNKTGEPSLYMELPYMNISELTLFIFQNGRLAHTFKTGNRYPFSQRPYPHQHFVFNLSLPKDSTATYLLKVKSDHPILLPLNVWTQSQLDANINQTDLILGIYMGILLAIFAYNLFIYISTRDRVYRTYLLYLAGLGLAQVILAGYLYRFLWPNYPELNYYGVTISTMLAGVFGILFIQDFLKVGHYLPYLNKILNGVAILYILAAVLSLLRQNIYAYTLLNICSGVVSLLLLLSSALVLAKGNRQALFYLVAWSVFLVGLIVLVLRNVGVLPYNHLTTYGSYVGSALETILLSFALADRINILKKEKEASQAIALEVSQENERLVREQNVILETKVAERTDELIRANTELNAALKSLKEAQTQLVEKEKMASLGQLTAGIAHEINNPINFVTSNIKPLKLDIDDIKALLEKYDQLEKRPELKHVFEDVVAYKKQIDITFLHDEIADLIKGIEDGAVRTAEIVRGLRTFSRLDESDVKSVDLHEGLDSTLVLLRNSVPPNVKIIRQYGDLPKIECYAGKLNQVFMNIITNSFNAIKSKHSDKEESLTITTRRESNGQVMISIRDTGTGMSQEVKEKIFDPFFTTKDVGEGTGLGLSIVFSIIEKHNGRIVVNTAPGEGAEFIIYLPLKITSLPN
ncbi:7TM diverse intracellular signaling domain-containing protein [uncultured Chitinophaga sp.]|jgi:Signal transduction histidine kinase regulating C4-dicarboxylate transport system|uniref:sensor histidine kinase n=1 Tax=uncultured Chitinophaga sp. TaxID=339340 RepID=UPI002605A97D|nr:7TM diverse intracellular signaling domain-containing protein [uncultured Chitinophaga sp.]